MKNSRLTNNRCLPTTNSKPNLAVVGAFVVAIACVFSPLIQKAQAQSTQTPWQNLTQPQLSAVWWEWILSVRVSSSPWFDATGAQAATGQPYFSAPGGNGNLLFLIGTITIQQLQNGDVLGQATRTITIKQGTALFFPLINSEWDNICGKPHLGGNCFSAEKFPNVLGVPDLQALAAASIDAVTTLNATITPTSKTFKRVGATSNVLISRLQSPPFAYSVPASDNIYDYFGIPGISGTVAPAVSDGYWSNIPGTGANSLVPGYYVLQFGGSFPINQQGNTFTEAITYRITVTR
jgi:hypothetical protein